MLPFDQVDGEGVDDFVGEDRAEGEVQIVGGGVNEEPGFVGLREAGLERFPLCGHRLEGVIVDGGVECWIDRFGGTEDVEGELARLWTGFEEVKFRGAGVGGPKGMEPEGEETTEGISDTDAGDEVALCSHPGAVRGAVVAPFRVVKSFGHEIGKAEGAMLLDPALQVRGQERSCPILG